MVYCLNPTCTQPHSPLDSQFCQTCGTRLLLGNRYHPLKLIGQGGFGRTYLAEDLQKPSQPHCVIKQFYPAGLNNAQKAEELFELEALRLEQLGSHSQIPILYAHLEQDNRKYIVQEFIDGKDLAQELKERGKFDEAEIRSLLQDLLPVLQFLHQGEVIHRDIKPENIIRRRHNKKLVLVDFGAAKYATTTALAQTGTLIGSVEYVAPEQLKGRAVFASDLYSLGVTCLHLLVQISPFDLFDPYENTWIWRQYLVDNPVSEELGQILDKMVQNALRDRWRTAEEVLTALNSSNPVKFANQAVAQSKQHIQPQTPTLQIFEFEVVTISLNQRWFRKKREWHRRLEQAEYFADNLGSNVFLEMVDLPGGWFVMGSPEREGSNNEKPQHQVTVRPFFLGKYPITQEQWQAVVGLPKVKRTLDRNPSQFKGFKWLKRPVENVSWLDAVEFCERLSRRTGRKYRLPSEAEWEYACRAGTTTPFHFGETITTDLANYDGNYADANVPKGKYRQETTAVGSFFPNGFGLYDMHGNVWEWCADHWHKNYEGAPNDGTIWLSRYRGSQRLLRGGSWYDVPGDCRSAYRTRNIPGKRSACFGFRVACAAAGT
ncbi:SUMF1/EgtB/PvdO family nonheme iron enzyme [Lusitaniella coriacea LEGE 07157]|uniref:SUMF1/EgtB/PvdO family nonheme iron enzyme n=1 Tax=Lusitaniella coriacea LEGE 07157 TaxID=945747 RepID=A0A8J7ITC8_9CYAN|nr:bifunctional serine/threonine-protein kinase/formylglycine-generating enzyme family protein [Lusitaniella coriacea]MBE9116762.1 SUMF1/EgtB/PvdO family nonheme iron enzyme [Lusitaniella coriacea LEGE 07157]